MLVVLDTTVLIDWLRGRPVVDRVAQLHAQGDVIATTAINVEEIHRGSRPSEDPAVRRLFDGLVVVPLTREAAERAGAWRRDHAAKGVTLSQADCLIAACATVHGGVLATGNPKDFPMPDLRVEHWPVGT